MPPAVGLMLKPAHARNDSVALRHDEDPLRSDEAQWAPGPDPLEMPCYFVAGNRLSLLEDTIDLLQTVARGVPQWK